MANEKTNTEKKFVSYSKDALKNLPGYMDGIQKAVAGMVEYEGKKSNNMIQNVDKASIMRPIYINSKGEQGEVNAVNLVNLMHTQLTLRQQDNPVFVYANAAQAGFLKAKDGAEPTYIASIDPKKKAVVETKMYHISQLEVDKERLAKANAGRNKANEDSLFKPMNIDLSTIEYRVAPAAQKSADNLRKFIAFSVAKENGVIQDGKVVDPGSVAKLDTGRMVDIVLGDSIAQASKERENRQIHSVIERETKGMSRADKDAFKDAYKAASQAHFDAGEKRSIKQVREDVKSAASAVKGEKKVEQPAPEKELDKKAAKKAKKKEAPAR